MLLDYGGFSAAQFDFTEAVPRKQSYIVASSYRSGSTYLCTSLWKTGLLGAPFEYLSYDGDMRLLYFRLGATSAEEYLRKLIACRTSRNGVFGLKAHFHHFNAAIQHYPSLLESLHPLTFICIERKDKVAQAVSLAKAFQTRAWLSLSRERRVRLFYSREFIAECLDEVNQQVTQWNQWFELNNIKPLVVYYEDLVANRFSVVRKIVKWLGVENDVPTQVKGLPEPMRQSDSTSEDWMRRFTAETEQRADVSNK